MWVTAILVLATIALVAVGVIYLAEPAHSLPAFFPGHVSSAAKDAGRHHTKHGIAAIIAAVVALAAVWMSTGRRATAASAE